MDELFFDQCVAAGPSHIPYYFDTADEDGDGELGGFVCPPDGNYWYGEIVLNGSEPRLVSSGCIFPFAMPKLLRFASYPQFEDVVPLDYEVRSE
ncbi:MAG: hypothetical protein CMK09_08200 [Ponticaulis sp.]|nr:hypothetical protein [Ponticaulis sp.]